MRGQKREKKEKKIIVKKLQDEWERGTIEKLIKELVVGVISTVVNLV